MTRHPNDIRAYSPMRLLSSAGGWAVVLMLVVVQQVSVSADDANATEFSIRFRALEANDLAGHYKLAEWCKDQREYQLVLKQCDYILRKKADHAGATLLREWAKKNMIGAGGDVELEPNISTGRQGPLGRVITDEEIQHLRRSEWIFGQEERTVVKLKKRTADRFYDQMKDDPRFKYAKPDFFRLLPTPKAEVILELAPDMFVEEAEITSHTKRFDDLARNVMPFVLKNCATSGCHAENSQARWRLRSGRRVSENVFYTNYLLMHQFELNNERVINRDLPSMSMLLRYSLPPAKIGLENPTNHPFEIEPACADKTDKDYVAILAWIESLNIPTPDYGILLKKKARKRS